MIIYKSYKKNAKGVHCMPPKHLELQESTEKLLKKFIPVVNNQVIKPKEDLGINYND